MLLIYFNPVNIKIHFCMKININCMPIFYRTPNLTFVNVGQSMPKFYRESFQKANSITCMNDLPVQRCT